MRYAFLALLMMSAMGEAEAQNHNIADNTVFWDTDRFSLSATPHTLTDSGTVYVNLTSKTYTGKIDIIVGVDTVKMIPAGATIYDLHTHSHEDRYTCDCQNCSYTYMTYPTKRFTCWKNATAQTNQTTFAVFEHDFDRFDASTKTAYWTISVNESWRDVIPDDVVKYEYGGMNRWYVFKDVPVAANMTYQAKIEFKLPITFGKSYGKYWLAFKPSALNLQDAIAQDKFYALDPWWNTSFTYRQNFTLSGATKTIAAYVVPITFFNTSLTPGVDGRFENVRWVNETGSELRYWYDNVNTGNNATFFVQLAQITSGVNQTVTAYWGMAGLANKSIGIGVFPFYDHFPGSYNATLWTKNRGDGNCGTVTGSELEISYSSTTKCDIWSQITYSLTAGSFEIFYRVRVPTATGLDNSLGMNSGTWMTDNVGDWVILQPTMYMKAGATATAIGTTAATTYNILYKIKSNGGANSYQTFWGNSYFQGYRSNLSMTSYIATTAYKIHLAAWQKPALMYDIIFVKPSMWTGPELTANAEAVETGESGYVPCTFPVSAADATMKCNENCSYDNKGSVYALNMTITEAGYIVLNNSTISSLNFAIPLGCEVSIDRLSEWNIRF